MTARELAGRVWRAVGRSLASLLAPTLIVALLLIGACACLVSGVSMLAGNGWALIAAAASLFLIAAVLAKGMTGA